MRYPDFLSEGGTIGFVAPSFGCATEPYKTAFGMALDKFTQLGYALDLGPNCYESKGIGISNTPQACAAELTHMYESSESDVLISCGGGELMCEILEYVDFDTIKNAKPKWYLGYSDNTNFTFLQNIICDTAAVYGPCAGAFAMKEWHDSLKDTFDVLCGNGFKDCGRGMEKTLHGYDTWERESLKNEDNPAPQYNLTEKKLLRKLSVMKKELLAVRQIKFLTSLKSLKRNVLNGWNRMRTFFLMRCSDRLLLSISSIDALRSIK